MMTALDRVLNGVYQPGVYRFADSLSAQDALGRIARRGWRGWHLPGHLIEGKTSFLATCSQIMGFPAYFGRNWDAFEECITDLSWASSTGYLLLYDELAHFALAEPDQWQIALGILRDAADFWRRRDTPFFVLLRRTRGAAPDSPFLSTR
jgi:hypothetical protein